MFPTEKNESKLHHVPRTLTKPELLARKRERQDKAEQTAACIIQLMNLMVSLEPAVEERGTLHRLLGACVELSAKLDEETMNLQADIDSEASHG